MSAKYEIDQAAFICGWEDEKKIRVLSDFIDQMNRIEPNFHIYLNKRVDEDLEADSAYSDDDGLKEE